MRIFSREIFRPPPLDFRTPVGDRTGNRDQEVHPDRPARHLVVSGEAVDDPPDLGCILLRQDGEDLAVGVAIVDDDRQAPSARQTDLLAEGGPLGVAGGAVAEEIESRLTDRHHLVAAGEPVELHKDVLRTTGGVVGVEPHGRVHARVTVGDRDRLLRALRVDPIVTMCHPACGRGGRHRLDRQRLQIQVRVREVHASVPRAPGAAWLPGCLGGDLPVARRAVDLHGCAYLTAPLLRFSRTSAVCAFRPPQSRSTRQRRKTEWSVPK
jgi:hypothetical protein